MQATSAWSLGNREAIDMARHYDTPINAGDASFQSVILQETLPVVAVFWSPQETSREQLNTLLEQVAEAYAGEALIAKLEASDADQTRARYDVSSLPEFLFFREGKLIARAKGMPSPAALRPWMEYLLGRGPQPTATRPRRPAAQPPPGDDQPVIVTDANFDQVVLRADRPALVDCWAAWCGPCRMVAPVIETLANEFRGRALIGKLDVDANPMIAQRFGVRSIPTLIYFKNGREADRVVGAQSADALRQKLNQLL
jgi:thioredoxin 1